MNIRIKAFTFIVAAAACWASCKKNNDAPTILPNANLNVINASNNVVNFFQNGTRINNSSNYFPGGTLGYLVVKAGLQNYQVKLAGASTPDPLFTLPLKLDSAKSYSLFISGKTPESVFFINDTAVTVSSVAKIRFVNASPDAGPLVLAFVTAGTGAVSTPQFSNISYKTITPFLKVTPSTTTTPLAAGSLILSVYQAASPASPKKDTVTISAGRIYTFVSYGAIGSGGNQALGAKLIVNQ
jgi:hypothetical protein